MPHHLINSQSVINSLLDVYKTELGRDYRKYRNHVYRVFNYAWYLVDYNVLHEEKLAIAAVFHDIGIWTHNTFNYLEPSLELMHKHLNKSGLQHLQLELDAMVLNHHKLTPYKGDDERVIEAFRKADICDLSMGSISFSMPKALSKQLRQAFPYNGFHRFLIKQSIQNLIKHPLNPLPMFRW